jgi:hypothetical protein
MSILLIDSARVMDEFEREFQRMREDIKKIKEKLKKR